MRKKTEIIKGIKERSDRIRKTIYVSESVFKEAQRQCKETSISKVIEELLRDFIKESA